MWRTVKGVQRQCRLFHTANSWRQAENVIEIDHGTFFRESPSSAKTTSNPPLIKDLSFALSTSRAEKPDFWAIQSESSVSRTSFLQILAGQHFCDPPYARRYPSLTERGTSAHKAIKYVGFDADRGSSVGGNNVRGAYLAARYETRREEEDYTVLDYLTGHTELNALEVEQTEVERQVLEKVVDQLNLKDLLRMPVSNLSNGQTRRARIAKALMAQPEVLLLDGPFMGLDPRTATTMASVLANIAESQSPQLVLSLRPEDAVPNWITRLVVTGEEQNTVSILSDSSEWTEDPAPAQKPSRMKTMSKDGHPRESAALPPGEAVVEMCGLKVTYGDKTVLGDWSQKVNGEKREGLWWSLHRGQRCGIFGANGSGKTTMLSLITSDHPQTYRLPIKLFGRSRLPEAGEPGISVFDLQRRMGHSSPEVHAFFPKQLTIRRTLESAWADAPLSKPKLSAEADRRVDAVLRWFQRELNPNSDSSPTPMETVISAWDNHASASKEDWKLARAERKAQDKGEEYVHADSRGVRVLMRAREIRKADTLEFYNDTIVYDDAYLAWAEEARFRDLSFSSQRLLLFLRAIVAKPDLVILDEALSGIDEHVRDKALLFLSHGETLAKSATGGLPEKSVMEHLGKVSVEGLSPEQALLVISHSQEDVPGCLREFICLPEPGKGTLPTVGTLPGPLELHPKAWKKQIWR
jgi:ABC-type molybdenum transport system ATPase subunit/photorepair protein PhrA